MNADHEAIAETLQRIAGGLGPDDRLIMERFQTAGTPSYWEEEITIEHNGRQRYLRVRSPVDEGGASIGLWESPADPRAVRAIANALYKTQIWNLSDAPVEPGEELITWRYVADDEEGTLSVPAGSPILSTLSNLDLQLRRLANLLVGTGNGAALECELILGRPIDGAISAGIALVNHGKQDCLVQNPLMPSRRESDYIRIEAGAAPAEAPGVTGLGIRYVPLPMPRPEVLSPPWDQELVPLKANSRVNWPVTVPLRIASLQGNFARAVYSHYGTATGTPELPVVRGRAFSIEHALRF